MRRHLEMWSGVVAAVGFAMATAGVFLDPGTGALSSTGDGHRLTMVAGLALVFLAGGVWWWRRPLAAVADGDEPGAPRGARPERYPLVTLFLVSFVALFVEVALIRYCGSQLRVFSFYKNVPLVGCFLGLGLGCWLGEGRLRHVYAFLLWMIPVLAVLGQGSRVVDTALGELAAKGSSEHILGDFVLAESAPASEISSQLLMASSCVVTFLAITVLFTFLGRLLGAAFEPLRRIPGYTVNVVASLAGVIAFGVLSALWTPPWLWFLVGLAPLLWWVRSRPGQMVAAGMIALGCASVAVDAGDVFWSPYQKLVGRVIPVGSTGSPAYFVQISDVFYQVAVDLRPEAVAAAGRNPYPHYDLAFRRLGPLDRVLVVGAGTGNDVAAALRAGASRVDAVDIDPAIVAIGRDHHPERPYADPRVRVIVDDARRAFRYLPQASYDAVVFGLLDSHTQLGISSVRLDNYVFTVESFLAARGLLKPGGAIIVTAATFRPWFRDRFTNLLGTTCGGSVETTALGPWHLYRCRVADPTAPAPAASLSPAGLPTDDWPFLYLPRRSIPAAYLVAVAMLALTSVVVLRVGGLRFRQLGALHGHFFFLGSAFLLMEVVAINRLALVFGTTWVVSAVAITLVLTLIVAANVVVATLGTFPYAVAYVALAASLVVGTVVDPELVLGRGPVLAVAYGFGFLLPVFFAGLVFARSFSGTTVAGPALGANILGAVLGGWAEYATMAVGIKAMALIALVFYLVSALALVAHLRSTVGRPRRAPP